MTLADGTRSACRTMHVLAKAAWNAMGYPDPGDREILTHQTWTSRTRTTPQCIVAAEPVG